MATYDLTLNALLDGMPAAGIRAAPTDDISDNLIKAKGDWKKIKAELDVVITSAEVTEELKATLFHDLNVAMYDMEKLEHMYVAFSKHSFKSDDTSDEGALLD